MQNLSCVICYESNFTENDMYIAKCNHSWCKQCHQKLRQFDHCNCVICRKPLRKNKKKKKKRYLVDTYIDDEIDYEPITAFGFKRPWRIKRRLRRAMRALLNY